MNDWIVEEKSSSFLSNLKKYKLSTEDKKQVQKGLEYAYTISSFTELPNSAHDGHWKVILISSETIGSKESF
jgi:hypothetical protein